MATTIPNRSPLIVSPHLYLGDVTGRPLDYGMVFFGEPNKDPEFYPIKVFSDKKLKNELAQPVRTKGGFLNQFGDIVEVFAYEGVYSVKVLDQYGRKIFYKAEVAKQTIEDATSDIVDAAQVEINRRMFLLDVAIATATAAGAGASGWTDLLVSTENGRTQADKNNDLKSIKDFGAIGDGSLHKVSEKFSTLADAQAYYPSCETLNDSIDRLAIQKSLDDVGYAYIPQNTFVINVRQDKKYFIRVGANQRVFGDGDKSLLKVADNNGDYFAIFHQDVNVSVDNTTLTDFAIHQNVTGNSASVVTTTYAKLAICFYKFNNVKVANVKVYDACGVNTISLNAKFGKGAIVHDNDIFWKQNNPVHYDNSAIYVSCDNHWVYNNRFYGVIGESWGAIESHGSKGMVYDNTSFNYGTICNVTNYSNADEYNAIKTTQTKVFNNNAVNCYMGIRLWSISAGGALDNVKVYDNNIYIAQVQWFRKGINTFGGLSTEFSTDKDAQGNYVLAAEISNGSFVNNFVEFEKDLMFELGASTSAVGIQLMQTGNIDRFVVKGNEVINAPSYGIRISQTIETGYKNSLKNITCVDNTLLDCGSNKNYERFKRAAIFVGGKIEQSVIDKNIIKDTGDVVLNGYHSVYATSSEAHVDTLIGKQSVLTSSMVKLARAISVPNYAEQDERKTILTTTYPPVDGTTVMEGDVIVVTGSVAMGQPTAYQCMVKGTFGTLNGVTASMTAASPAIAITGTVNTGTVLAIDKAGTNNTFPAVGTILYLSNGSGVLSANAQYTVSNANVAYWQPTMTAISYKTGSVSMQYDPPSLAAGTQQQPLVMTLPGAVMGNSVVVSFSQPLQGTRMWAEVTSANTVTAYHRNDTGSTVDLPSGTLTVKIV